MLEFKNINIIKNYKYQIIKGKIKTLSNTNLQFVSPTSL